MTGGRPFRRRFRLRRPDRAADRERELDEEIEFHLAMRTEELVGRGETPERARAEALRRFGDLDAAKQRLGAAARARDARRRLEALAEGVGRDAALALRRARRTPGFTAVTVLTFALGIGLTTAMYSLVDHVLLRGLPFPEADRLVALRSVDSAGRQHVVVSMGNWADWQERSATLEGTALHFPRAVTVVGPEESYLAPGQLVAGPFFDVLRAPFLMGRSFTADEVQSGAPVVVVSERFWRTSMASDPDLERTLLLNGRAMQAVGVVRHGREFPHGTDLWIGAPHRHESGELRNNVNWMAIGRLRPGVTMQGARAELDEIADRIRAEDPAGIYSYGVGVLPLQDQVVGHASASLLLLMGGVTLVLLIACANVAGLSLARGRARARELAVRLSIGAGRGRVAGQLTVEMLVLAVTGGALGVLLAGWAARGAAVRLGPQLPGAEHATLDGRVLVFALLATVLAGVLAAVLPAVRAARVPARTLVGSPRTVATGGRNLPGAALIAGEVALALVLLTGGGLLLRSYGALVSRDLGYDPSGVLTVEISLTPDAYRDEGRRLAFWRELVERGSRLPGVEAAAVANWIPTGMGGSTFLEVDGVQTGRAWAGYRAVSDDYFRTLRIALLAGRSFGPGDASNSERIVVVNRTMAEDLWPGRSPLGARVRAVSMERHLPGGAPWLTVVGVVEDVRHWGFEADVMPEMYVLYRQVPTHATTLTMVLRGPRHGLGTLREEIRTMVRELDPEVAARTLSLEDRVGGLLASRRITMTLLSGFAALALLLAAMGIYGLMAFAVAQQTREMGIRAALGAPRSDILGLMMGSALRVAGVGGLAGLAASWWASRLVSAMLVEVRPTDPATYLAAVGVLLAASALAAALPAWRACRTDPLITLREP